jgi:hypothetical protein
MTNLEGMVHDRGSNAIKVVSKWHEKQQNDAKKC